MSPNERLSKAEHDELESIMELRDPDGLLAGSITRLHGFLSCIVSGPMIMPSEWIPVVLGNDDDRVWDNMEEAQHAFGLLMRLNNEISGDLVAGHANVLVDMIGDEPETCVFADDWCTGYVFGMALRPSEWKSALQDAELATFCAPIIAAGEPGPRAAPERAQEFDIAKEGARSAEVLEQLPECADGIFQWWRKDNRAMPFALPQTGTVRRTEPKVSPNAPCPCGSGKKYKRCCRHLQSV